MKKCRGSYILLFLPAVLLPAGFFFGAVDLDKLNNVKKAVSSGLFVYRITEPDEIKAVLGPPQKETESRDGGMLSLALAYGDVLVQLGKMRDSETPFTLRRIYLRNEELDLGRDKPVVLRGNRDLNKVEPFWGLQNISLVNTDLSKEGEWLQTMAFDTLTVWPHRKRLPHGFEPLSVLEEGRNPGLGIRLLHEEGFDGRGVGIAVIDQPLLLSHMEYCSRITHYDASGLSGLDPQMHASSVASIAVGAEVGVAPGASLAFYAVAMWERENNVYIRALKDILRRNKYLPDTERIRAVSISTGVFSSAPHFEEWNFVLEEAQKSGVFVMTCDRAQFPYATLCRIEGRDPDDFKSYVKGNYGVKQPALMIPAGNRTLASHRGRDVYTYDRLGGMSWASPYVAGLAALAFQVDRELDPSKIWDYLAKTAVETGAGPVVNPAGFIAMVRERRDGRTSLLNDVFLTE